MKLKHIRKLVDSNCRMLEKSNRQFRDIYDIIFKNKNGEMSEHVESGEIVRYTYGMADADINRLASAIISKTGLSGSYIGLYSDNRDEFIVSFWAILRSGNKPYLINTRQPAEFTEAMLATLGAGFVISANDRCDIKSTVLPYRGLISSVPEGSVPDSSLFGDSIALSTSGTTLKKKICIYSGNEISAQILNSKSALRENPWLKLTYKREIKLLAFLPLYHIFGLEAMYFWFQFFGVTLVYPSSMSPDDILGAVRRHNVTHVFAVPLLWHTVEKSIRREIASRDEKTRAKFDKGVSLCLSVQRAFPRLGILLSKILFRDVRQELFGNSVKFCISGGSRINTSTLSLINALGYHLCNGYGMTEIGIASVELSRSAKYKITESIGIPFPSLSFAISDSGTLLVKGKSVCKKIITDGKPEIRSSEDWFDTGDLASADGSGRYYIHGRTSDLVYGDDGEKLNPETAEAAFDIPGALELCVLGDETNEKLLLVVRIKRDALPSQLKAVASDIEKRNSSLPLSYRVKAVRYTYDPLMREGDIKANRAYIRRAINEGGIKLFDDIGKSCEVSEETEIKRIVRGVFAEVLGTEPESISDTGHFLNDLGGSSLDYFTLVGTLNRRFDISMDFEGDNFGFSVDDFTRIVGNLTGGKS